MIYVYGVMTAPGRAPEVAGLEDAPVECRDVAGLIVAASLHAGDAPALSDDAVLRHAEVVDALARSGAPVLPARFGLAFADEDALDRSLRERRDELAAALEHVNGCVELGLRVLAPEQEDASEVVAGGDYLRARLRETEERERLARELHDALAACARAARRSEPGGRWLLSAAYLVPAGDVEAFRRQVQALEASHPELELLCTGPWPPYNFAPTGADKP
jgi:signal transduction histidine kinase